MGLSLKAAHRPRQDFIEELMLKFSRFEWRWLLAWSFFTLGLTLLPLIWGLLITPPGHEFTGILFNAYDGNTYMSKMEEGRRGDWVFHLSHTSEAGGDGAVTFVFYLLLGKLAGLLGLPNIIVFHLARLLCGLLLLIVSYGLITLLFTEQSRRRWAFVLVCLASGLGWLFAPLGLVQLPPADFWVAEAYTFLSIFANPHFPLASALLILIVVGGLFGLEGRGRRYYGWAALLSFILGFVHPFMLFTVAGVLGVFWLRLAIGRGPNWFGFAALIGVGLAGVPGPLLTFVGTQSDPLLREWMKQNQTSTLDIWTTLVSYGLLVPLGAAGIWWAVRALPRTLKDEPKPEAGEELLYRWQLITGWVIVTAVLMALPFNFSRRFSEGLHLPLCCLATAGWFEVICPWLARRGVKLSRQRAIRRTLITLTTFSSLLMLIISISLLYINEEQVDPVRAPYFSAGEVGAFAWLRQNARVGDVVLTGPLLGNVLPGRAPVRVFYGHPMETLNADQKYEVLKQFCDISTTKPVRSGIIYSWGLKYLVYGWRERKLGDFDPTTAGWPQVYNNDGVQIYLLSPTT